MGLKEMLFILAVPVLLLATRTHSHSDPVNDYWRSRFTPEQLYELQGIFNSADINHDGSIGIYELETALKKYQYSYQADALQELFNKADINGNQSLDVNEFLMLIEYQMKSHVPKKQTISELFRYTDKNANDFISAQELILLLSETGLSPTEKEVREMIKEADVNGDWRLSYKEFKSKLSAES